jgi:membrane protein DedA with SNARE-associated domain
MFDIAAILASPYALVYIFFLTVAASFVVVPAMGIIIITMGAYSNNISQLLPIILVVYAATMIGDISAYFVARIFSKPVLRFMNRFKWFKNNHKRSHELLEKYGFLTIFISRFLNTEVCLAVNYISGFIKFYAKKFILAVVLGEFVYAVGYTLIGYFFRESWRFALGIVQGSIGTFIAILVLFYILHHTHKRIRHHLKNRKKTKQT